MEYNFDQYHVTVCMPSVALAADRSKAVFLLLMIHCSLLLQLFVWVLCLVLVFMQYLVSFLALQSSEWRRESYNVIVLLYLSS